MIKPAPYNPRKITDEEFKGLKHSINSFGDISGITFNKRTGNLVTGHHRYKAITEKFGELEFDHIFGDRYRVTSGKTDTGYEVRVVDWEDSKEIAANIAANSHTIAGSFDPEALSTLMQEVKINTPDVYHQINFPKLEKDLGIFYDINSGTNEVKELYENESNQKSAKDQLERYLMNDGRIVKLYIMNDQYEDFIKKLDEIMTKYSLETVSDAMVYLVKHFEIKE